MNGSSDTPHRLLRARILALLFGALAGGSTLSQGAGPTVTVANTSANPVPTLSVDNAALQPFQHTEVIGFNAGLLGGNATFTVPGGKRLVIEFVSFSLTIPAGQRPTFNFVTLDNPARPTVQFGFALALQGGGFISGQNSDVFVGTSPTRLYADPGSTVTLGVRRNQDAGTGLGTVSVSGYYVNVP
jgi:hypothetical protein